jgi:Putative zinc-finger
MNCDECKNLIGVFMDNELDAGRASAVRVHLAFCADCAAICEDLATLVDVCKKEPSAEIVPPNAEAMWRRISNTIESENTGADPVPQGRRRFWQFSFAQLSAALLFIVIVSSLVTIAVMRGFTPPPSDDLAVRSAVTQTTFQKLLSKVGLADTPLQARDHKMREREAAIDYWNARVMARRDFWDARTREAFDRNLQVIDDAVNEYTVILQRDPEDELSGEMLDSVLTEKMNLLRDFSDL